MAYTASRPPFTPDQRLPPPAYNPHKYPYVGPYYMEAGEIPGFIYNYQTDRYVEDPSIQKEVLRSQGVLPPEPPPPPKPPGFFQQVAPITGAALLVEGGKHAGPKVVEGLGGLLSSGKEALTGGASGVVDTITSAGRGLLGLSGGSGGAAGVSSATNSILGAGVGGASGVAESALGSGLSNYGLGNGTFGSTYLSQGMDTSLAGGAGEAGEAGLGIMDVVLPIVGAVGMYDILRNTGQIKQNPRQRAMSTVQGAASGAAIGSPGGPVGAGIGAVIGGLIGLGESLFGSGKGENQAIRDSIRKTWRKLGILDKDMEYKGFDVDQDGKKRLSDGRRIYEIGAGQEKGEGDPFAGEQGAVRGEIVADINPLNVIMFGGDKKAQGYGTGMMFNMLYETSGGKISKKDVFDLYNKTFANRENALSHIDELIKKEKISAEEGAVYKGNIARLYSEMSSGRYEDYKIDPTAPLSTPISKDKIITDLPATESRKILSEDEIGSLPVNEYRDNIDLPSGEIPTTPITSQQLPDQAVQGVPVASSVRQVLSPEEQKRLMEEAMRRLRRM